MQTETITTRATLISTKPIFAALHDRIYELPENFSDFVQSECNMTTDKYDLYLKCPEKCPPEEMEVMLKVAGHLVNDLKALILRCKQAMVKSNLVGREV